MPVITAFQMGEAPVRPVELTIGSPLLLPTQTPTATLWVNPTVQLSLKSVVVPVFTDVTRPPVLSGLFDPISMLRATLSLRMSRISKAIRGSSTCLPNPLRFTVLFVELPLGQPFSYW